MQIAKPLSVSRSASGPSPPRHGQKGKGRDGRAARQLLLADEKKKIPKEGRAHFDLDGEFAGYGFKSRHSCARTFALAIKNRPIPADTLPGGIHGRPLLTYETAKRKEGEVTFTKPAA